jgi:hypothetical protein
MLLLAGGTLVGEVKKKDAVLSEKMLNIRQETKERG